MFILGNTKIRSNKGSALIITVACTMIAVILGAGFIVGALLFGGNIEAHNATDAGCLNVATQFAGTPSVTLQPGAEQDIFSDLTGPSMQVNLKNYNLLVARALAIGINAKNLGTQQAKAHALTVLSLVQTGSNSIGARLVKALSDQNAATVPFNSLAQSNNLRMLGQSAVGNYIPSDYEVSCVNIGQAANINVDSTFAKEIPASDLIAGSGGKQFLKGYTPIQIAPNLKYYFVPNGPQSQPHLISLKDFSAGVQQPFSAFVPPNSFSCSMKETSQAGMLTTACSTIGVNTFTLLSMPTGYIKIVNPKGFPGVTTLTEVASIFNRELTSGIYLALDQFGNVVGFTTDKSALAKLMQANAKGTAAPALTDSDGNTVFFDASGKPASPAVLGSISQAGPVVTDFNADSFASYLPAFALAYPSTSTSKVMVPQQLMSNEEFNYELYEACKKAMSLGYGGGKAFTVIIPPPAATGLRAFNRNLFTQFSFSWSQDTADGFVISQPGTIPQLLNQIGNGAPVVFAELKNICLEIKSDSQKEAASLMEAQTFDLDTLAYLVRDQSSGKLQVTNIPPNRFAPTEQADGKESAYSVTYNTTGTLVNPFGVNGFPHRWWNVDPPQGTTGTDSCQFTPSSGFHGLLGQIEFQNKAGGGSIFSKPN